MNVSPSTLTFILLMFFTFVISSYISYGHKKITWLKLILGCSLPPLVLGVLFTLLAEGTLFGMAILILLPTLIIFLASSLVGALFGAGMEVLMPSIDKNNV